jgi:Nicotinamide mononucleotide transporter
MGHEVVMSSFTTTLIEWGATLLSLYGSWLCIRHRAICFVVFSVADLGWLTAAWITAHPSLLAQQTVYILLNLVGYVMWRRDERLREALEAIEDRELAAGNPDDEELMSESTK